jgi:hypothetical protein
MFIGNMAGPGGRGGLNNNVPGGKGGTGGSGGAIANNAGAVQVASASFLQNQAGAGGQGGGSSGGGGGTGGDGSPGGGIYGTGGSLSVTNGTFVGNQAGSGGTGGNDTGGGSGGNGGNGGDGGAVAVNDSPSGLRNATLQQNAVGTGGAGGVASGGGKGGAGGNGGTAGGIFVQASMPTDNLTLRNTIVASSIGDNCDPMSAIADGGHNLTFGDKTCPAVTNGDPKLSAKPIDYGGYTATLALAPGSAAINQVPRTKAGCPSTDQRGVRRPQGSACDIGAFEFARPRVQIYTPRNGARYKRGARVHADFRCVEGGITSPIQTCAGTVTRGHRINTSTLGRKSFKVSATDKQGNTASKTVNYTVIR